MILEYVDKLPKHNNGVKYLLVRQDLSDRSVDAKGMKKKRFQGNNSCIFDFEWKKRTHSKKNGLPREQTLLESFKIYAQLKEF